VQLVNGQPDSFLYPLAAPRYGRRGLLAPEQDLSTIPQLLDQTPDGIWGDHAEAGQGTGSGYGSGHGRMAGSHRSRPPSVRMGATMGGGYSGVSDLLSIGNLAEVQQAAGVESAALFIYTLPRPLDLRAHGSALVPFVQAPVSAVRVTRIDGLSNPRMGVLFTNLTKQTLPPGPISFFSDGGFAGESALERLKPEERRYLVYGVDIDVEVSKEQVSTTTETRRLEFKNNELNEHYVRRDTVKHTIENRSGQPRAVHWPIKVVTNSKVEGADEVRFDEGEAIAVFQIPARKKVERTLHTTQGLTSYNTMSSLSSTTLERLSTKEPIPEDQRKVVLDALEKRKRIEQTEAQLADVRAEMERLDKDLERFREHLKALGGETGGVAANPFVKRIMDAEDRLEAARTKERALKDRSDGEQSALRAALMPLKIEERKPAD
jgi:hypothetical protein